MGANVWGTTGRLALAVALLVAAGVLYRPALAEADSPPTFVTEWPLDNPFAVAVRPNTSLVYVLTHGGPSGVRMQSGSMTSCCGGGFPVDLSSSALTVDSSGNIYVVGHGQVEKFAPDGTSLTSWATSGSRIAWGGGHIYVAEASNHRIKVFTENGALITDWQAPVSPATGHPEFVAVDQHENVYVVAGQVVQKFTAAGSLLAQWGSAGAGPGQFDDPAGIAVDGSDDVYVLDMGADRVTKFSSTGTYLAMWGTPGSGTGQFTRPYGIAASTGGDIFVADTINDRVQRFAWPRPDARIRKGMTGTSVGDNVYNTTGANQTRTGSSAPGTPVTYYVTAQNDATFSDRISLRGTATTSRFTVRYSTGGADITGAVTAGTYTRNLGSRSTLLVRVDVTPLTAAPSGSSLTAKLTVKSTADTTRTDVVKFVTTRR